ncbi:hypothetical protein ACOSQ3_026982 [Xanthoceras sorbifolium]
MGSSFVFVFRKLMSYENQERNPKRKRAQDQRPWSPHRSHSSITLKIRIEDQFIQRSKEKFKHNSSSRISTSIFQSNLRTEVQISPAIRAFGLEEYVFSSMKCPQKYVESIGEESGEVVQTYNDDYLTWKKNDQMIVCWLLSLHYSL